MKIENRKSLNWNNISNKYSYKISVVENSDFDAKFINK